MKRLRRPYFWSTCPNHGGRFTVRAGRCPMCLAELQREGTEYGARTAGAAFADGLRNNFDPDLQDFAPPTYLFFGELVELEAGA